MILLRLLTRLVGFLWALALAIFCLGVALFCLDALIPLGRARPDRLADLPRVRRKVGHFLAQLQAPGHVATLSLLAGVLAVVLGLLLLRGALGTSRKSVAVLDSEADGLLAVRRRVLAQMLRAIVAETSGVLSVKRVRVTLARRRRGGVLRVVAVRLPESEETDVGEAIEAQITPLTDRFGLRQRVLSRGPNEHPEKAVASS